MHSTAWVKLFRYIPANQQANLMLVTTGGTEIAIQCFLRIDTECVALKGRLAGSQDSGRVFFVPYSHIDYLGFQQAVKESEFHELFGGLDLSVAPVQTTPAPEPAPASPSNSGTAPVPESASGSTGASATGARNPLAIKSAVLEKFRARSQSSPGTTLRSPLNE